MEAELPPCQRLVVRCLPFDTTEIDFMKYLTEKKSCAAFLGDESKGKDPAIVLTSFKRGKAACKHKGRGPVCATAFLLAENPSVAMAVAASLDSIAFNAVTEPNLLMSVEYSAYQEAPVGGGVVSDVAGESFAMAGTILTDPEYLAFVETVVRCDGGAAPAGRASEGGATPDVENAPLVGAVTRETFAQYSDAMQSQLIERRQTSLVKDILNNWFHKIPFAWERRKMAKQQPSSSKAVAPSPSTIGSSNGGKSAGDKFSAVPSSSSKKRREDKRTKSRKEQGTLHAQGTTSDIRDTKKKRSSTKKERRAATTNSVISRTDGAGGGIDDGVEATAEELKRRAKREKEKERKRKQRKEQNVAVDSTTPETPKTSRRSSNKNKSSELEKDSKRNGGDNDKTSDHKSKKKRREKNDGAPQPTADGGLVVGGRAFPRSKEQEILDRERDKEARKRRMKEKDERRRRQEELLQQANAKAAKKSVDESTTHARGGDAAQVPKKNTFTVSTTRRVFKDAEMPMLDASMPPGKSAAPQGAWSGGQGSAAPRHRGTDVARAGGDDSRPPDDNRPPSAASAAGAGAKRKVLLRGAL